MGGALSLTPLYSSSDGNSTLVTVNGHHILIDLGRNCKQCTLALRKVGVYPDDIEAVFLTHSHSDHISGVKVFMKNHQTPVYGTRQTLSRIGTELSGLLHEIPEKSMTEFKDFGMKVISYPTHHDAAGSVVYRIANTETGRSLCVMTDLGYVTEGMLDFCSGCDGGLFESNYDPFMLENGPYDYVLKKRIRGNGGHISNNECSQLLEFLLSGGTSRFVLGHLSPINNTPEIARRTITEYLGSKGYIEGVDYHLGVAQRFEPTKGISL